MSDTYNNNTDDGDKLEGIYNLIMQGIPPFVSPKTVAKEILNGRDANTLTQSQRELMIDKVIAMESKKAFGTGFTLGLGGGFTMLATIPAGIVYSLNFEIRLMGIICELYGIDCESEQGRGYVLSCLGGLGIKEMLRQVGVQVTNRLTRKFLMDTLKGPLLKKITQIVGRKVFTKAGQKSLLNVAKVVPIAGGLVGGLFDGISTNIVGKRSKDWFRDLYILMND